MTQHFDYTKPDSVEQAAALLAAGGHAIGGGTDLLTQVHRGIRTTEQLGRSARAGPEWDLTYPGRA